MRHPRALPVCLILLFAADGALAASKHEQTRRSASRKSHASRQADRDSGHGDSGSSDPWGSCLSGCFSAGCDVAGEVAVDAIEHADEWDDEAPPPAPGLEAGEVPGPRPGPRARPLPPELTPGESALPEEEEVPEDEAAPEEPAWMPDPPEDPAAFEGTRHPVTPATGGARVRAVPADGAALPGSAAAAGEADAAGEGAEAFGSPAAFGVAAGPPPPLAPAPDSNTLFDLRTTGAWVFADLPNASFDARAGIRTRDPGPGLEVWYTGLWERIDGEWDHLPVGGARFSFGFGTPAVRPDLHLGGALLHLGERDDRFAFDAGLGLEVRLGDEGAPWLDLHADALLFEGFTATDVGGGVSFPGGPFYVRIGARSLYLETFYAGPEIALGLRL